MMCIASLGHELKVTTIKQPLQDPAALGPSVSCMDATAAMLPSTPYDHVDKNSCQP
eukprot:CAMPEP_0202917374 /NCGR_PEP_ID=MMETSP1392-20130828/70850_1 /ASSEMBLY_ACC=CAM_ASM_000868 /TAXON_ID=225041 /ORGANISM="Chlamydomonas chlamydogama, Strain SAG 11-48b" /LENGTH=55 /DNA_ID=CAMNT_0049610113 /DNA_START=143 /DNA_END=310 /DNA_ORIENTATION=-